MHCGAKLDSVCGECGRSNPAEAAHCMGCGGLLTGTSTTRTPTPEPAPAIPDSFASGRYRVERFLGEGGKKRVYLARDPRLDREVAVAFVKTEGLDEGGVARVRREAQAMGRLGSHPHIVTVHDTGDEGGQPFIVQEFMDGGSLDDLLEQTEDHRLSLERALAIAGEVCRALGHAHSHGVIHRDLKPGNVWLTGEGIAKLGDFGLAVAINQSRLTQEGMMIGTSLYMPPEQAVGGEATERSDLYSFGCMLYEMVAGRPPFVGDDPTSVISQHINTAPVAPSWYTEHCPPDLEELILRLLAKDPAERPESASQVIEALARVDPAERSASHTESNVLDRLARGVFVGRDQELERLRKAFDAAFAGHGGMVMLVGEPGIGKTRTAQELETHARVRGAQVLWGAAHESAGAPAYWPWVQVGRGNVWADNLAELQADMQGAEAEMTRIFPELRQNPAIGEPAPVTDPEAAQFRLFDAYATFVRAMAKRTPLLIALDDLHWADKPSLLLLQHLARELSRMRVLIVGTYRDTELVRTHPLSETLASLNRETGFQRVVLRGLSRDEVAGYIRAAANVSPNHDVLDRIYEETEGNPFFLSEVVNLLTQEGALTRDSVSDIAVPDGVREALGRRLDRISEETNELLQVAAVAGREFAYETLTLLGDRKEEELLRLIEEALEARVIEEMEQPGRYRFMHALMQETLLGELSTTRRVRLHGQVGDALERRWGDRAGERAPRLARHFVEAAMLTQGHAEKAVRYSKLAARQAEEQSGWAEAAKHYEDCLTLVTGADEGLGEDEAALLVAHGICARNAGEYRASWRSLMRAITLYREQEDPAGMAGATLESLLIDAPPARQLEQIRDALAALGDADPYLEARLLSHLIYPRLSGRMSEEELSDARQKAAALVEAHGFDDVHAQILSADSVQSNENGEYERAADLCWQVHQRFAQLGRVGQAASALFNRAVDFVFLGRIDDALSVAEHGLAYAREYHHRWSEENCAGLIAVIRFLRCEYEEFDEAAEERASDASYIIHVVRAARAEQAGDLGRAVARLPEPSSAGGDPLYLGHIHAARARVLLHAGDRREAQREFGLMREALNANPVAREFDGVFVHGSVLGSLDEAILVLGDDRFLAAAESRVRELHGESFCDPTGKGSRRIVATILLHRGKIDEAEERYRMGLEWAERERCPVEEGRCLQGLAEVAERRGDAAEAMQLLDRAAALFQRHGAKLYLDRVIATKVKLQGITSGDIRTSIDAVAAVVESEQPDLRPHAAPDGTVTLLFTDIEGSTAMTERLGDQPWMALLREHNALVREQIQAHDGYEVKTEGDGFMVAFSSARKALQCAIAIQRAFAEWNESADEPVRVRIGLHTGEPVKEAGDFYGKHVVLASRIADAAKGGEILVSALLKELTESSGDVAFGEGRGVELKGLSGTQRVFEVAWE